VHLSAELIARLHGQADASKWGVSRARFDEALIASATKGLHHPASPGEIDKYLSGLHLEDLALACACADGHDGAWEHFVRELRPVLYRAADAIVGPDTRELADSLYADLFGLTERDGQRRSLFRYFHGRSGLATWLRAVLAQRYIDQYRSRRREQPLPEEESTGVLAAPPRQVDRDRGPCLDAVTRALRDAIASLPPKGRLRLGCYYGEDLTLKQIGRITRESEATVSRQLARARRTIRDDVERRLRNEAGMTDAAIAECLESVTGDAGTIDLRTLLDDRKESAADRSLTEDVL
jgi:RNA polymerase sigma-70 factor (ECF subfamily)